MIDSSTFTFVGLVCTVLEEDIYIDTPVEANLYSEERHSRTCPPTSSHHQRRIFSPRKLSLSVYNRVSHPQKHAFSWPQSRSIIKQMLLAKINVHFSLLKQKNKNNNYFTELPNPTSTKTDQWVTNTELGG